ncbi:DUF5829 family protein [Actinophytocola oryzae]|uniref:Glyoxalase-like protein n=1 Tax=Actinophytocola oryzae TaxID=502181 RepID=A0A4R7W4R9_9PSEU|nr:DUF5829 family protein [Actinophytocola oryzae]TDV57594.1 hypothetical protein CLV71_101465 [Actinophytocola oryzae]
MKPETDTLRATPTPYLDHVMVLVDRDTYGAVLAEEHLGATFGRRKHKQADSSIAGSYSTLGIAGRETLVELFEEVPGGSPMRGGLVFSFERTGSAQAARSVLDGADDVSYYYDLVRRAVDGADEPQPWYHLINVDLGPGSPFVLFLNEVTPEYFASLGAKPADDGALRRREYLDAALGETDGGDRVFGDIRGVTIDVTADRASRIAAALTQFGFTEARTDGGVELSRADLTLSLRIAETERVTGLRLELFGADPGTEFTFGGGSKLVVDSEESARWLFF